MKKDDMPKQLIMLKYTFTEEETLKLGQESAQTSRDIVNKKAELDTIKKEYMAEIKHMEAQVDLMAEHITNGFKMERVSCIYRDTDTHRLFWTPDLDPEMDEPVKKEKLQQGHQYSAI